MGRPEMVPADCDVNMQTADMDHGEGMIVAGDCKGDLHRIFYKLPQQPYITAEDIQAATLPSYLFQQS